MICRPQIIKITMFFRLIECFCITTHDFRGNKISVGKLDGSKSQQQISCYAVKISGHNAPSMAISK